MSYKIPLFDLNFDQQEKDALVACIDSNWISSGPQCEKLEIEFAKMLKAKYALSMANCTAALHLALDVAGIKPGDEVICPSLTFVASVNAIKYVGAIPVFCDIVSYEDFSIDPSKIESLITEKTKAIMVVHFAGFPCNMDAIVQLSQKYALRIIEDACHGPLSEYKGKKLGTIGDIGCFSFFSNKNISTGEGGMIVTNNEKYYNLIKLKRSHGMTTMSFQRANGHATVYDVVELGYNYRMDDLRASVGIVQLKKLEADLKRRALVRANYERVLVELKDYLWIPYSDNSEFVSNYIFPIVLRPSLQKKRDEVRNELHARGIQTSVHYPAIHRFSIYKEFAPEAHRLEITEYVVDNEITLPMYAALTLEEIEYIKDSLKEILCGK